VNVASPLDAGLAGAVAILGVFAMVLACKICARPRKTPAGSDPGRGNSFTN
jgi:hypothetical protein